MIRRPATRLVLAIVAAAVVAGCGGGGDSGDESDSSPPARSQFVKKVNAICQAERAGLSREASAWLARDRQRGFPHDVLLWRVAHYVLLPHIEHELRRVLYVDPPPADEAGVHAAFSAERVAVDKIANVGRLSSMTVFHDYFAESGAELRAIGLGLCANDGVPRR